MRNSVNLCRQNLSETDKVNLKENILKKPKPRKTPQALKNPVTVRYTAVCGALGIYKD